MKHNFIKAIIYNIISAVLIVNFDFIFVNKALQFNEKVAYIFLTFVFVCFDIIFVVLFIFLLLKLFKATGITFSNIIKNLISEISFVSLICTSISLLLCGLFDNINLGSTLAVLTNIILYIRVYHKFLKEFNLSEKNKYIILLLLVFPYFLKGIEFII